jgi:hypothetical protein
MYHDMKKRYLELVHHRAMKHLITLQRRSLTNLIHVISSEGASASSAIVLLPDTVGLYRICITFLTYSECSETVSSECSLGTGNSECFPMT